MTDNTMMYAELLKARLLRKRKINEQGCWIWTGCLDWKGYGQIKWANQVWHVHRLAIRLWKPEKWSPNLHALHVQTCFSKACFNPEHLYMGNDSDNANDYAAVKLPKTHCPKGHEYTPDNILMDRGKYRRCRKCRNERNRVANLIVKKG